jgi:hypothetical protein
MIACGSVLLLSFAAFLYGSIPAYCGGGAPMLVQVFTKEPELPANRFMATRNSPQINPTIPSFRLRLLYESPEYFYFVAESRGRMRGHSVMRLSREQVLRLDYVTPFHF